MDYFKIFLRGIESDKQKFKAYIKKNGYIENLGQNEYREIQEKINRNENITYAQKADLCARYTEMLAAL